MCDWVERPMTTAEAPDPDCGKTQCEVEENMELLKNTM